MNPHRRSRPLRWGTCLRSLLGLSMGLATAWAAAVDAVPAPTARAPIDLLDSLGWTQVQHDAQHTGRSDWTPWRLAQGFALHRIEVDDRCSCDVVGWPLLWRGKLYVVCVSAAARMTAFVIARDHRGRLMWKTPTTIDDAVRRGHSAVGPTGWLYVPTAQGIEALDLHREAAPVASSGPIGSVSRGAELTVGQDGRLFVPLAEASTHHIRILSPDLVTASRTPAYAGESQTLSTIAVSADGARLFALAPRGALVMDATRDADPQLRPLSPPGGKREVDGLYHVPIALPQGQALAFAGATGARVWQLADAAAPRAVSSTSSIAQPVLDTAGRLRLLMDGAAVIVDGSGAVSVIPVPPAMRNTLAASSNLVIDGGDNLYFWNDGRLTLVANDAQRSFEMDFTAQDELPVQGAPLLLGPDGTLWTAGEGSLFALVPTFSGDNGLVLGQADLRHRTAYVTAGRLRWDATTVSAGIQVLLQAEAGISLGAGFRVAKGAGLIARVGGIDNTPAACAPSLQPRPTSGESTPSRP